MSKVLFILFSVLNNSHIVPCLGVEMDETVIRYLMPFYEDNLRTLIAFRKNLLTPWMTMKLALDVLKGLEYLHTLSIIHRDLKPDNILVSKQTVFTLTTFYEDCKC